MNGSLRGSGTVGRRRAAPTQISADRGSSGSGSCGKNTRETVHASPAAGHPNAAKVHLRGPSNLVQSCMESVSLHWRQACAVVTQIQRPVSVIAGSHARSPQTQRNSQRPAPQWDTPVALPPVAPSEGLASSTLCPFSICCPLDSATSKSQMQKRRSRSFINPQLVQNTPYVLQRKILF